MSEETVPEFIMPKTIADMTDEDYELLLNGIRERRMILVTIHTQATTLKNQVKAEKLLSKLSRYCGMVEKEIAKLDKIDENITLRVNQMRALKMEAIELEEIE